MTYGAIWEQRVSSWKAAAFAMNEQFLWKPLFVSLIILVAHSSFYPGWIGVVVSFFSLSVVLAAGWVSRADQAR